MIVYYTMQTPEREKKKAELNKLVKRFYAKELQIKKAIKNTTRDKYIKEIRIIHKKIQKMVDDSKIQGYHAYGSPIRTPVMFNRNRSNATPPTSRSRIISPINFEKNMNRLQKEILINKKNPFNSPKKS